MSPAQTQSGKGPRSLSILVVGASARAAAQSLARADFSSVAVDLFGDRDLARMAPASICPADEYPDGFLPRLADLAPGPVMYTGGLENYPHVVTQLATKRELWGNAPEVLIFVRNPFTPQLHRRGAMRFPRLVPRDEAAPSDGLWLRKPLKSAAGHGIRFAAADENASEHHYFQEFIEGRSLSALFVSGEKAGDGAADLLGVSEQIIGASWAHARPFAYCGNIGPIALPPHAQTSLREFGQDLAQAAGLRGVWGLDFIAASDELYALEVNPRYTAGAEVLELGLKFATLMRHARCFTDCHVDVPAPMETRSQVVGKAIYFSAHPIIFPNTGPWDADLEGAFDSWRVPGFADIPVPGAAIERGSPVLTVFATGSSVEECRQELQSRVKELDRLFSEADK